jgi:hypothetical protein
MRGGRLNSMFVPRIVVSYRMTKLPPGFTHEVKSQLVHNPPFDERTKVPFLDLDNYCCGELTYITLSKPLALT